MGYSEDKRSISCPGCGVKLLITVKWIGYGPANEWEHEKCPKCGAEVAAEKCGGIDVEVTPE